MKSLYAFLIFMASTGWLTAQVAMTFEVDMTDQTVGPNGVHMAGNFYDPDEDDVVDNPDGIANWDPASIELTDMDGDMVYSVTLNLMPNTYEFKFINGNTWDEVEDVPPTCQVEVAGNDNRYITVSDAATFHVCYASCAACGDYAVRFRVDMTNEGAVSPNGVHVAGEFQSWQAGDSPLQDMDGDMVWEGYHGFDPAVGLVEGELAFKFINGNDWANPNENITGDCGNSDGNRSETITDVNTVLPIYCYNVCEPCTQPTAVTLQVDMNNEAAVSVNGVHVAGSFQAWQAGDTPLTDQGGGIWSVTLMIAPGTYEYKFINGDNWGGDGEGNIDNESIGGDCNFAGSDNRELIVGADAITVTYCYNQCSASCVADPDPANITFSVDVTELADDGNLSTDGIWLIGSFTEPAWQAGATLMDDSDGDNIWTATVLVDGTADIQYKFTNGDPYPGGVIDDTISENYDFEGDGCGIGNGIGGWNRTHTRSGSDETLSTPCWNSCEICVVSVEEFGLAGLQAFPNPAKEIVTVTAPAGAQLTVNDAAGRIVYRTRTNVSQTALVVRSWQSGVYNVLVQHEGRVGTIRLIVE